MSLDRPHFLPSSILELQTIKLEVDLLIILSFFFWIENRRRVFFMAYTIPTFWHFIVNFLSAHSQIEAQFSITNLESRNVFASIEIISTFNIQNNINAATFTVHTRIHKELGKNRKKVLWFCFVSVHRDVEKLIQIIAGFMWIVRRQTKKNGFLMQYQAK